MKNLKTKIISTAILTILLVVSCTTDVLEEKPRSVFTPDFFQTELGVEGGLTYLYSQLRYIYGQAYYYNSCETGTDEYTWGESADGNFKDSDLSGVGTVTSTSYPSSIPWNVCFPSINTASGIIENASGVGLSDALISEARFFRAFSYFLLVQTYGGVPLDLGAGELAFNTSTFRGSVRNTVPEVYTKGIFPDLVLAVNDLPDNQRLTGTVTKNVARLYLSKAYLTYAWWLQNPNNIPTYPEAPRTDPDGHDAAWYFQQAYDVAMAAINNPGEYGLLDYYYDVNYGPNDRNKEWMFYADHTEASEKYNGASLGWSSASGADNAAVWMVTSNYTTLRSPDNNGKSTVLREAAQSYGRPWTRMAPTIRVFKQTFADKDNDSRYDGTFVTSYRGNWDKGGDGTPSYPNANGMQIVPGDAVVSFLDQDDPAVDYGSGTYANLGGGQLPGRSDFVINTGDLNRRFYPGLWKLGTYRTDNNGGLGSPNGAVTRPFPIAKFSEFYFIAAEAAVKGASGSMTARALINVIRARAGKWRFDNGEQQVRMEDNSAAMVSATPTTIDIDYILAERSREFFGEGYRWYDLVRTQKWSEYAATYSIAGVSAADHSPQDFTRTIQSFHYLRPIPQGQLDSMEGTEAEKDAYQNPGYD